MVECDCHIPLSIESKQISTSIECSIHLHSSKFSWFLSPGWETIFAEHQTASFFLCLIVAVNTIQMFSVGNFSYNTNYWDRENKTLHTSCTQTQQQHNAVGGARNKARKIYVCDVWLRIRANFWVHRLADRIVLTSNKIILKCQSNNFHFSSVSVWHIGCEAMCVVDADVYMYCSFIPICVWKFYIQIFNYCVVGVKGQSHWSFIYVKSADFWVKTLFHRLQQQQCADMSDVKLFSYRKKTQKLVPPCLSYHRINTVSLYTNINVCSMELLCCTRNQVVQNKTIYENVFTVC